MLKKPHKSCRRDGGNGRDFGGKRKNVNTSVGSVAAASYNLDRMEWNSKEAVREAQTRLLESVSRLWRLIKMFS